MVIEREWLCALEAALQARAPGKNWGLAVLRSGKGRGALPQIVLGAEGRAAWDDGPELLRYFRRTGARIETSTRRGYGSHPERRRTTYYTLVTLADRRPGRDEWALVEAYTAALAPLKVEITEIETEPMPVWKREAPSTPFALPHEKLLFSIGLRRSEILGPCASPCV
ncbi:MAG: hypothetical protein RMM53_10135 [Bacteroidia bacterium]|nr:hypothetical protein [Bacteroidia bacterium]